MKRNENSIKSIITIYSHRQILSCLDFYISLEPAMFFAIFIYNLISCVFTLHLTYSTPPQQKTPSITLLGGEDGRENVGFVAFKTHTGWQLACASFWGVQNSKVVCRELGYRKHLATEYKR